MDARSTIIRPLVTEKSMHKVAEGRYVFAVTQYSTKTEVRKAIESTFNVKVVSLSTSVVKGKAKRAGKRRLEIKSPIWKKAIVTVKKGDRIYLFESGAEAPAAQPVKEEKEEKKDKKEKKETKGKKAE
jgi:large subunit ribosomal protein L23